MPVAQDLWRCPRCKGTMRAVIGDYKECLGCGYSETLQRGGKGNAESPGSQPHARGPDRRDNRRNRGRSRLGERVATEAPHRSGASPGPTGQSNTHTELEPIDMARQKVAVLEVEIAKLQAELAQMEAERDDYKERCKAEYLQHQADLETMYEGKRRERQQKEALLQHLKASHHCECLAAAQKTKSLPTTDELTGIWAEECE